MSKGFARVLISLLALCALSSTVAGAVSETFYYPTGVGSPTVVKNHAFGTISPKDADQRWLCGVRIEAKAGEAVYAVADGEVTKVSPYGWGNGNVAMLVRHSMGDGRAFIAVYGCVRNYATGRVRAGEKIGTVGREGYMHFGIFESADGAGAMPFVSSQSDYASPSLPRPAAENIDGTLSYGRWFDPIDYLRRRSPRRYEEVGEEQPAPPAGAPGAPTLMESADESLLSMTPENRTLKLRVRPGSKSAPSGYRFRIRRVATNWWVADWRDWTSEWVTLNGDTFVITHILPPGEYWWEAQARNECGEGVWRISPWRFHVNFPPGVPVPQSPTNGAFFNKRQVKLSWSDPGDPDNRPHRHRDYRVVVEGDWSYDSGWGLRSTSVDVQPTRDGHFTWRVAAGDGMNESAYSASRKFTVDTVPPEIQLGGPATAKWIREGTVSWQVADATSGVKQVYLKWEDGPESAVELRGSAGIREGKHSVTVRAVDNAGNESKATFGVIWADLTPPVLSVFLNPTTPNTTRGGYTNTCTITALAEDAGGSGLDGIACRVDGYSGSRYTGPITVTGHGSHQYSFTAVDAAGNESQPRSGLVSIEGPVTGPPTPGPTPVPIIGPTPQPAQPATVAPAPTPEPPSTYQPPREPIRRADPPAPPPAPSRSDPAPTPNTPSTGGSNTGGSGASGGASDGSTSGGSGTTKPTERPPDNNRPHPGPKVY
jgi:hypothetical protein